MKNGLKIAALVVPLLCGAMAWGTQDSTLDQRDVRDPRRLETILEANFADAETRLAAEETLTAVITRETASAGTLLEMFEATGNGTNSVVVGEADMGASYTGYTGSFTTGSGATMYVVGGWIVNP